DLINSTVSGNSADSSGGGISARRYYHGAFTTLTNTIVSGNTRGDGATPDNLGGVAPTADSVGNLVGSGAVSLDPATNLVGVDNPRLAPLGDCGGPTQTMALLPGSPAINAGVSGPGIPTSDQRGKSRVGAVDF